MGYLTLEERKCKKALERIMYDEIPQELHDKLDSSMEAFRRNLHHHPAFNKPKTRMTKRPKWMVSFFEVTQRYTWQTALAALLVIFLPLVYLGESTPTWANVTKQFKTIPFFHAVIHAKDHNDFLAEQFEIWMGPGGNLRLAYGTQVVFANVDGAITAFNIFSKEKTEPLPMLLEVIEHLNTTDRFSLETVIQSLTGTMGELQPVLSRIEEAAVDISIFDLLEVDSGKMIRIWTLSESLLPIYLQQTNLQNGDTLDIFFLILNLNLSAF